MLSLFTPKLQNGALIDQRDSVERQKDYKFEEMVASANPVNWQAKPREQWRKFPIFNQNGSGSCVAQTGAKLLGINYSLKNNGDYVHFSATDIYQRRSNKPQGGMFAVDAFSILTKGVTLEELARSQSMTDAQMDGMQIAPYKRRVGDVFKIGNYVALPTADIDTIASTIETTGKGVMVWFYFTYDEWTNEPFIKDPNLSLIGSNTVRHSVTAVDYTIWNGKKALVIEDSWGRQFGWDGQRVITEDFFKARNYYAGYALDFDFTEKPDEPVKYQFTKPLEFSTKVEYLDEVKPLQDFLKQQGTFPQNISSTGYYGAVTAKAVLQWQLNNVDKFIAIDKRWDKDALTELGGKYFGNVSIQVANTMTK